jgi:hypothetical protein
VLDIALALLRSQVATGHRGAGQHPRLAQEIWSRYCRGGSVGHITIYPDPAGAARKTSAQGQTDISILRSSSASTRWSIIFTHSPTCERI